MTKSVYADRETVGSIALKASQSNERVEAGDMGREMMKSFVDDLNEAIQSKPFGERSFYITVHEKKDLLQKNMIRRRVLTSKARPYPEPATTVFWTDPKTHETKFCWSIPHWSFFPNVVENEDRYGKEQVNDVKAYMAERMDHFGFVRQGETRNGIPIWVPNPKFQDRKLK